MTTSFHDIQHLVHHVYYQCCDSNNVSIHSLIQETRDLQHIHTLTSQLQFSFDRAGFNIIQFELFSWVRTLGYVVILTDAYDQ